jgi:hypothetical protein
MRYIKTYLEQKEPDYSIPQIGDYVICFRNIARYEVKLKYIKTYEANYERYKYLIRITNNEVSVSIDDIMDYLYVKYEINDYGNFEFTNRYNIDFIDFLKEIFLEKEIEFKSINKITSNPYIKGKVKDISEYGYKDELFIQFKIYDKKNWHLAESVIRIYIQNYDAENKPLHKEVELKKEAEKYNL